MTRQPGKAAAAKTQNGNGKGRRGRVNALPRQRMFNQGVQVTQQISTGVPSITSRRDRIVVVNRELIATVSGTATAGVVPTGGMGVTFSYGPANSISPTLPTNSWSRGLATLYDKYAVKRLTMSFQPALPVTTGGVVGMWFDSEPGLISASGSGPATVFDNLSGNMNAKTTSVHEPMQIQVRADQLNRLPQYITTTAPGGSIPTSIASPGTMVLTWSAITLPNASAAGATTLGYFWIDYEIEFINPSNPST